MNDLIDLYIPFRSETFGFTKTEDIKLKAGLFDYTPRAKVFDILEICRNEGIDLNAYGVSFDYLDDDSEIITVSGLNVPFEQLESSFSGIALKVNHAPTIGIPHISLKASPAKLLLGHNIYGFDDIKSGVVIMLYTLIKTYPFLSQYLNFNCSEIRKIDITYSFKMKSKNDCIAVLDYLRTVSFGQTKANEEESTRFRETVIVGSKTSKHKFLRIYYKYDEVLKTIQSKNKQKINNVTERQLAILSDTQLQEIAMNSLRIEACIRKVWIEKIFGSCMLREVLNSRICLNEVWNCAMSDLKKAVGDVTLKNQSDESIRQRLNEKFVTYTKKGNASYANANNIFAFYRLIITDGYNAVKDTVSRATFYRRVQDLESVGVTRAMLQSYTGNNDAQSRNIIPFIKILDVTNIVQTPIEMPDYTATMDKDILSLVESIICQKAV